VPSGYAREHRTFHRSVAEIWPCPFPADRPSVIELFEARHAKTVHASVTDQYHRYPFCPKLPVIRFTLGVGFNVTFREPNTLLFEVPSHLLAYPAPARRVHHDRFSNINTRRILRYRFVRVDAKLYDFRCMCLRRLVRKMHFAVFISPPVNLRCG
jgi:hypothetical protein